MWRCLGAVDQGIQYLGSSLEVCGGWSFLRHRLCFDVGDPQPFRVCGLEASCGFGEVRPSVKIALTSVMAQYSKSMSSLDLILLSMFCLQLTSFYRHLCYS